MREIIFRCWHKKRKEMRNVTDINFKAREIWVESEDKYENLFYFMDDVELMQFTGLLDKNGSQIFEGDILKGSGLFPESPKKLFHVYFIKAEFLALDFIHKVNISPYDIYEKEIIGNIYENSELLENK